MIVNQLLNLEVSIALRMEDVSKSVAYFKYSMASLAAFKANSSLAVSRRHPLQTKISSSYFFQSTWAAFHGALMAALHTR